MLFESQMLYSVDYEINRATANDTYSSAFTGVKFQTSLELRSEKETFFWHLALLNPFHIYK